MIGANTLINTAILQLQSNSNTKYFQNKVSPMHQETFISDDICSSLGNSIGMLVLVPLILLYLRQTSAMLTEKEVLI